MLDLPRRGGVVSALLAFTLVGCGGDGGDGGSAAAPPTATTGATAPTAATGATAPSGATPATAPTGPTSTDPGTASDLEDGRHFGFIGTIDEGGVTFDLAYFYTGDEANEQAAAHGDETPVPNDYYVVNDNPRLRDLELADGVTISVFDWNHCCDERVTIDVGTFAEVIAEPDGFVERGGRLYYGVSSPYWLTVEDGSVTEIEEQYLP